MDNNQKTKVIICGFGQIGRMLFRAVSESSDFAVAGVIDSSREIVGENAGKLAGAAVESEWIVQPDIFSFEEESADIVIVCTASKADDVAPLILNILKKRFSVITTCEEFNCLWFHRPDIATQIDVAAKSVGAAVLGTGINPGFLMDFLPAALLTASRNIASVRVERVQDASVRRSQFQKKIGAGLSVEQFEAAKAAGSLRHVGLTESVELILSALGFNPTGAEISESIEMIVADSDFIREGAIPVRAGQARGVRQIGRGRINGKDVVELVFVAALGEPASYDRIVIDGTPRLDCTLAGGVNGDGGTCAVVLNMIPRLLQLRRIGLFSMLDLAGFAGHENF